MDTAHDDPRLDELLAEAAPATLEMTPDLARELRAMQYRAHRSWRRSMRRRRWVRSGIATTAGLALIAGAATAAAAAGGWFGTPLRDASLSFEIALPSGAVCTAQIREEAFPEDVDRVKEIFASLDIPALLTDEKIHAAIAENRRLREAVPPADRPPFSADDEYLDAAVDVVSAAGLSRMAAEHIRAVRPDVIVSESQTECRAAG